MAKEEINYALPKGTIIYSKPTRMKYKVFEVLGAGGFGITYKVEATVKVNNVPLKAFFAIKEHFMSGCDRADDKCTVITTKQMEKTVELSRKDFIVEAKRLNKLGNLSENIVKVNEVFEYFGTAYYVMQYLDGGALYDYIFKEKRIPEVKALKLFKPVAKAVAILHEENLLHLDIKPDNIVLMTKSDTNEIYPVLIDFGIAKHFNANGKPTSTHSAKGASDGYAPMEQYSKIDYFEPKMDVYALAATLLHMLSGQIPKNAFDITEQIIQGMIPGTVSQKTRAAIIHAMKSNKKDRTPSVNAFINELEAPEPQPVIAKIPEKEETPTTNFDLDENANFAKQTEEIRHDESPRPLKTVLTSIIVAIVVVAGFFGGRALFRSCSQTKTDTDNVVTATSDSDSLSITTKDVENNGRQEETSKPAASTQKTTDTTPKPTDNSSQSSRQHRTQSQQPQTQQSRPQQTQQSRPQQTQQSRPQQSQRPPKPQQSQTQSSPPRHQQNNSSSNQSLFNQTTGGNPSSSNSNQSLFDQTTK